MVPRRTVCQSRRRGAMGRGGRGKPRPYGTGGALVTMVVRRRGCQSRRRGATGRGGRGAPSVVGRNRGRGTRHAAGPPAANPRPYGTRAVSYTHLRAHETRHDLVCRLLLEKK